MRIPYNRPHFTGNEMEYIRRAQESLHVSGDGAFTRLCQDWLRCRLNARKVLLTHSCTGALEMAAILSGIGPGDEVILPSYTFSSTANAFALRGAKLVFVDIRSDTFNIDERKIVAAITPRTRVIVPVHYAGVGCAMKEIMAIADAHGLLVIEDAAQAVMSEFQDKPLGSFGHMAAFSFHETKNIISGEGGALVINDDRFLDRAEVLWQKGTNRNAFLRGEVDKYTWIDIGSSFVTSDISAAFLWAQIEAADRITRERMIVWKMYFERCISLESSGALKRPVIPPDCRHNAHMFFVTLRTEQEWAGTLSEFKHRDIGALFHYVPLHSSIAGRKFGRVAGTMDVTNSISKRLIRLPLWVGMTENQVEEVVAVLNNTLSPNNVAATYVTN